VGVFPDRMRGSPAPRNSLSFLVLGWGGVKAENGASSAPSPRHLLRLPRRGQCRKKGNRGNEHSVPQDPSSANGDPQAQPLLQTTFARSMS